MIPYHTLRRRWLRACFFGGLLLSCGEAPRDNPLDPLAPDFDNRGQLLVYTQTYYSPNQPLPGVSLLLKPDNLVQLSNAEGLFRFRDLPADTYLVVASKPDFVADSQTVVVQPQRTSEIFLQLDAKPLFSRVSVRSEKISAFIPIEGEALQMVVEADLQDGDGLDDIQEVKLFSASFGLLQTLQRQSASNTFAAVVSEDHLTTGSLYDLIGDRLWLEATDRAGALSISDPAFLIRIIEPIPLLSTPSGLIETDSRPRFQWENLTLPFDYRYRINLLTFDFSFLVPVPFRQIDDIPSDSLSFVYDSNLSNGAYLWTLSIVDRFGNSSRSREAVFLVR
ncbi:carboxypeptidase regulatory-like domain-containing protein [candidate division KSB1 bacterium]|nr:carboxypeptidase regulatory-like domain-containing protein [candidate division KSB1 bacterium]